MTRWVDSTAALEVVTPDGTELMRVVKNGVSKAVRTGDIADADAAAAIAAHVALSDPHTQYLKESDATAGYQPLDADLTTIGGLAKADGNFIVGDGSAWTAESGNTARTSLGVGTGDSPQFTAINLGHATDTTVARLGAGRVGVEGVELAFARYYDVSSPAYNGSIQPAIDAAAADGGGTVMVPYGTGTYDLGTTGLTAKSNVCVMGIGWPTIAYTGSGEMIGSASTGVLTNFRLAGFVLDHGASATHGINLRSAYHCHVEGIRFRGLNSTVVALKLSANSSGATNNDGNYNGVFNRVADVLHDQRCGTFIQLEGNGLSQVITLNEFHNVHCREARVRGWDFAKWCDNNYCSFSRVSIIGNSTVGVEHNTADPTNNVGVYANNFGMLAVDTFNTYTGRIGIKINNAKQNKVEFYYQYPDAEGGDLVVASNSASYHITKVNELSGTVIVYAKNYVMESNGESEFRRSDGNPLLVTNYADTADADALVIQGDRATPAGNDRVNLVGRLSNASGTQKSFAKLAFVAESVTAGSEIGQARIRLIVSGTESDRFLFTATGFCPNGNGQSDLGLSSLRFGRARLFPYTVAGLPSGGAGDVAFASNGRKNGEGAGAGTGVQVFHDGTAWRACDTGATVAA